MGGLRAGGSLKRGGAYHGPTLVQIDCVQLKLGRGGGFIRILV